MTDLARLRPTVAELREMAQLATPIVLVNVGLQGMGFVDVLILGRISAVDLAAAALGNFYFFMTSIIGMGVLMALDPVVAQAVGARDEPGIARGVQRGLLLTLAVTVAIALTYIPAGAVLSLLGQPADVTPLAAAYVRWCIPGLLPFFAFNALRQVLQALTRVRPIVIAVLVGNVANALLNWMLIFGHFGFEPGGVVGSSQGTAIARWIMLLVLLAGCWPVIRSRVIPWRPESLQLAPLWRMLKIGAPIAMQLFAEAAAFGLVTVMTGWMGTTTLAGHEITLSLAALTFMVPMGVAAAAAVMVGHAVGAGDIAESRRDAVAALAVGVGFMAAMAVVFWLIPGALAAAFTTDAPTRAMATLLIPIAAVFQVFDGTQVISASILRGAGDTRVPMLLHVLSFWAVGIPLGALVAFRFDGGAPGLWWGLTAGLAAAAVLQLARVRSKLGGEIARVRIDRPTEQPDR
ncbi:MAG: MATE family efflux transporter [Gemmatimonadetes bacterium]|nr:MATE family efflux transporter [Gemmatimonadota bacterium]